MRRPTEQERRAREWRWMRALVREVFLPRREGGPRPERLEALGRGEIPTDDGEAEDG